jgi:hypothetical protein
MTSKPTLPSYYPQDVRAMDLIGIAYGSKGHTPTKSWSKHYIFNAQPYLSLVSIHGEVGVPGTFFPANAYAFPSSMGFSGTLAFSAFSASSVFSAS